jgi:hypothetical protein
VPWSSVSLRSELRIIARSAGTYFVGVPDVTTLPLLMFTASLAGNYQIAAITALVLLVPSVGFMLLMAAIGVHEDIRAALQFGIEPLAASNSKVPVPAPVTVGHSMPWRASRSRVCPALSTAWAIAWRRSSAVSHHTSPIRLSRSLSRPPHSQQPKCR